MDINHQKEREMILKIEAAVGAGDDFLATVLDAVAKERSTAMIQVAGEYGHLYITEIEVIEDDD